MFNGGFDLRRSSIARDGQQKVRAEYIYDTRASGKNHKVRITVVSDSYRNQCEAKAERFNGTSWQMVGRLATAEIDTEEGLCYRQPSEITESMFSRDIEKLKDLITAVLS